MTLTFISNYINHHQIPFCNALYEQLKEGFCFVQTQPMEAERIAMGWQADNSTLPYVKCMYEEKAVCQKLILESDVLLAGWTEEEEIIGQRLRSNKLTIRISERLYREGQWKAISPKGLLRKYREHTKYRNSCAYLLCAGAYVPSDFHIVRAYPDKMYRWGYFPETIRYTSREWEHLKKEDGCLHIVWAGRFIPLKHPEHMIRLAEQLKARDDLWKESTNNTFTDFKIHMVGSGEMEDALLTMVQKKGLEKQFVFYGFMAPQKVRKIMEMSHIHVFTSNWLEGWGAVVNEGMNSGCAEVVNVQTGAAPYLIEHGKNGLVYPDGNPDKMTEAVISLAENPQKRAAMGRAAYETIITKWNAEHAARELLRFASDALEGRAIPAEEGPLSTAPVVSPGRMYQWMLRNEKKGNAE